MFSTLRLYVAETPAGRHEDCFKCKWTKRQVSRTEKSGYFSGNDQGLAGMRQDCAWSDLKHLGSCYRKTCPDWVSCADMRP